MLFASIAAVDLDYHGRLFVLERRVPVIRVFSDDGTYLHSLGRYGEGPGEFRSADALLIDYDGAVWVRDRRSNRYTVFDPDGTVQGVYPKEASSTGDPVMTEDGTVYETATRIIDPMTRERSRVFRGFRLRGRLLEYTDSIIRPVVGGEGVWNVELARTPSGHVEGGPLAIPFFRERHDHVDPRRGFWTGMTDEMRFVQIVDGDTVRIIERTASPTKVTPAIRTRALSELKERFGERLRVRESDIPDFLPSWKTFFLDSKGRLWVERYPSDGEGSSGQWEIYNSEGEYLGLLPLPIVGEPVPAVRGNRVAGVARDSLNVETVVVHEVDGLGGER